MKYGGIIPPLKALKMEEPRNELLQELERVSADASDLSPTTEGMNFTTV